jgi:hypothetical protein
VARHHRRRGSKQSWFVKVKPTRSDYAAALRQGATWIEVSIGLVIGVTVGVIGTLLGAFPTAWLTLPIAIGTPISNAAQRVARNRDLHSRSNT